MNIYEKEKAIPVGVKKNVTRLSTASQQRKINWKPASNIVMKVNVSVSYNIKNPRHSQAISEVCIQLCL